MTIAPNVIDAIGKTPLIELRAASKATGCRILGKAEFMNPGGSVKDRAALYIVSDAIARGTLKPGGLIVEGTAGIPASASPWSPTRSAFRPSSSFRKRSRKKRSTHCACQNAYVMYRATLTTTVSYCSTKTRATKRTDSR